MIATAGPGLMGLITVFVLAAFVGFEVISKVPSVLHTPADVGHQRHSRHHHRGGDDRPGRKRTVRRR